MTPVITESNDPQPAKPVTWGPTPSERDWPEDAGHENGNYSNTCFLCGQTFIGHKRRPACRVCSTASPRRDAEPYRLALAVLIGQYENMMVSACGDDDAKFEEIMARFGVPEQAIGKARDPREALLREHSGDCTKECHSCIRCQTEHRLRRADELISRFSAPQPPFDAATVRREG